MELSVIIPCLNEEKTIAHCIKADADGSYHFHLLMLASLSQKELNDGRYPIVVC